VPPKFLTTTITILSQLLLSAQMTVERVAVNTAIGCQLREVPSLQLIHQLIYQLIRQLFSSVRIVNLESSHPAKH
jgi:uncharacterized membrane protein YccC